MSVAPGPPRPARSWQAAISLFTIIPAGGQAEIPAAAAGRLLAWLPVLGGLLASVAGAALWAVQETGPGTPRKLLAAVIAVAILTVLTGGLHLDGLADTADGLGSRRPREQALDLMRKSDIGPMGVAALVFTVLIQVSALAVLPAGWPAATALVTAAITGRVAALLAADLPPARPEGLGALVAGSVPRPGQLVAAIALLAIAAGAGFAAGGPWLAARTAAAVAGGLAAGLALRHTARRHLGGITGDVFGALIEIGTTTTLLLLALL